MSGRGVRTWPRQVANCSHLCSHSGLLKAHRDRGRCGLPGRRGKAGNNCPQPSCAHTFVLIPAHDSAHTRRPSDAYPRKCDLDPAGGHVGFGFNKRIARAPACPPLPVILARNRPSTLALTLFTFAGLLIPRSQVRSLSGPLREPLLRLGLLLGPALRASAIGMSAIGIEDVGDIGIRVKGEVQKQNH
jgi:hypothetical protein